MSLYAHTGPNKINFLGDLAKRQFVTFSLKLITALVPIAFFSQTSLELVKYSLPLKMKEKKDLIWIILGLVLYEIYSKKNTVTEYFLYVSVRSHGAV
jgi:hypothetical protein